MVASPQAGTWHKLFAQKVFVTCLSES